ncbi:exported hypothetical protein [Actinacidiphila bryophytorum]|uniref:Uncharacterized protein n=1 Tax=Actinacidiphila bryophytorum TaxID=1436133 RepID=A0A9W4MDL5_9ACTN|nr:exported hypothetical protein [Actinacidiphila bryophytorum]
MSATSTISPATGGSTATRSSSSTSSTAVRTPASATSDASNTGTGWVSRTYATPSSPATAGFFPMPSSSSCISSARSRPSPRWCAATRPATPSCPPTGAPFWPAFPDHPATGGHRVHLSSPPITTAYPPCRDHRIGRLHRLPSRPGAAPGRHHRHRPRPPRRRHRPVGRRQPRAANRAARLRAGDGGPADVRRRAGAARRRSGLPPRRRARCPALVGAAVQLLRAVQHPRHPARYGRRREARRPPRRGGLVLQRLRADGRPTEPRDRPPAPRLALRGDEACRGTALPGTRRPVRLPHQRGRPPLLHRLRPPAARGHVHPPGTARRHRGHLAPHLRRRTPTARLHVHRRHRDRHPGRCLRPGGHRSGERRRRWQRLSRRGDAARGAADRPPVGRRVPHQPQRRRAGDQGGLLARPYPPRLGAHRRPRRRHPRAAAAPHRPRGAAGCLSEGLKHPHDHNRQGPSGRLFPPRRRALPVPCARGLAGDHAPAA